jgi:hypothetical protein
MDRDSVINVRLPEATKAAAKVAAEADSRSLSAWIALTLRQRLAELGYLDAEGKLARRGKRGG